MLSVSGRRNTIIFTVVLLAFCWGLARHLEPQHERYVDAQMGVKDLQSQYLKTGSRLLDETPFHAIVPAILGVRELTASLLWIQADNLFHRGDYEPVLDLIYRIVAIDPHQIDVYATGAWHMAYNFLDKRMIWDGVKFLEDGIKNNPAVYDLFFELGYTHQDKTKDFPAAIKHLQDASEKGTSSGEKRPPFYVSLQLAHAMERAGWIDLAEEQWRGNVKLLEDLRREDPTGKRYQAVLDTTRKNYYLHRRRRNERRAAELERQGNAVEALKRWEGNVRLAQEILRIYPKRSDYERDLKVAEGNVARVRAGHLNRTPLPETHLDFTVRRIAPRQIEVKGTLDVLDLARVRIILRDKDYEKLHAQHTHQPRWHLTDLTLELDDVQVINDKFEKIFKLDQDPADMGRDPAAVYPLKSEEYELIVQFDPRLQSIQIQDRYGWSGEGLQARKYLKVDRNLSGLCEGRVVPRRYLEKRVILKRSQIV